MRKKTIRETIDKYAALKGFELNQDQEIVEMVIEGLCKNKEEKGFAYCPCVRLTGDKKIDRQYICPCKHHVDDIEETGHCHCMLYFKNNSK